MKLSKLEIFTLFVSSFYLATAEVRIRFSKSGTLLKQLQNLPANPTPLFFLGPLHELRRTRIVSLLEAVDRNLGWKPSCLRRTLALAWLSCALGFTPKFKIGVQRWERNLRAHSWLEVDGVRLEMDSEASEYTVL